MNKVGHQILIKGDIVKAPGSRRKWVVVEGGDKVTMLCLGKKITKKDLDLAEWIKIDKE